MPRNPAKPPQPRGARRRWLSAAYLGAMVVASCALLGFCNLMRQKSHEAPVVSSPAGGMSRNVFPRDQLTETDYDLGRKVNVPVPGVPGRTMNPEQVWEARQRIFLAFPNNRILWDPVRFKDWEDAMQAAVDDAAAAGVQLDDWEIMQQGRDRIEISSS